MSLTNLEKFGVSIKFAGFVVTDRDVDFFARLHHKRPARDDRLVDRIGVADSSTAMTIKFTSEPLLDADRGSRLGAD